MTIYESAQEMCEKARKALDNGESEIRLDTQNVINITVALLRAMDELEEFYEREYP